MSLNDHLISVPLNDHLISVPLNDHLISVPQNNHLISVPLIDHLVSMSLIDHFILARAKQGVECPGYVPQLLTSAEFRMQVGGMSLPCWCRTLSGL